MDSADQENIDPNLSFDIIDIQDDEDGLFPTIVGQKKCNRCNKLCPYALFLPDSHGHRLERTLDPLRPILANIKLKNECISCRDKRNQKAKRKAGGSSDDPPSPPTTMHNKQALSEVKETWTDLKKDLSRRYMSLKLVTKPQRL